MAIEETVETFVETVAVILTAETGVLITPDPNAHINIVESQATKLTNAGREFEMKATTKILDIHQPSISQPEGVVTNNSLYIPKLTNVVSERLIGLLIVAPPNI